MSQPAPPKKLAGLVLGLLVLMTYGSTGPYAAVLSAEWLLDRRRPHSIQADVVGLVSGIGGSMLWSLFCVMFWTGYRSPHIVLLYWRVFLVWLLVRALTRWRELAAFREADDPDLTPR